jgi:hypothetical protein
MKWWGCWHAFRRGLATNLHRLGVSDKTIRVILRHANISTTLNNYVNRSREMRLQPCVRSKKYAPNMYQLLEKTRKMEPKSQKTNHEMEPARGIEPPTYGLRILFAKVLERNLNHLEARRRPKGGRHVT